MMTPFVIYIIVCIGITCTDMGSRGAVRFTDYQACESFAQSLLERGLKNLRAKGMKVSDTAVFCLKLEEGKEA